MAHRYIEQKKNHTRNVSRLVIVNTEFTFVDVVEALVFPIILSIVNDVFDFWFEWMIGFVDGGGGSIGIGGGGGGNNGKHRLLDDDVGRNENGIGGNDGGATEDGTGPWWKHAGWWWWWWWWLIRLKRLRRRKNEPLSNIFSLAGSNVQ